MRFLHTSDWHVGKALRGRSRIEEHRAVLAEIAEIADRERVDAVLVVGDLFDTAAPPPDATATVWDALLALRETGAHIVVVGGNHDQQQQLESVAPVFARLGIDVVGLPAGPDRAILEVTGRAGDQARVVAVPWLSQRWAIRAEHLMQAGEARAVQFYADRVRALVDWLAHGFGDDTVNVVAAHCYVAGGTRGGGERLAQLIDTYAVPADAFPAQAGYVALGHLHRTQSMPGLTPMWYSGSPIQVDFGEAGESKQVLVVDVPARGAAQVTPVPITRAWELRKVAGTLAELEAGAAAFGDAWLNVEVREQPRPGLADDVRALLPRAVDVVVAAARRDRSDTDHDRAAARAHATPRELFGAYLDATGHARDERLLALFDELLDTTSTAVDA
jgi:exonuclease SbcD